MNDSINSAQALLDAARQSIERDDVHSLVFAIKRAADLGAVDEALALGTSIQHVSNVPASIAQHTLSLLQQETVASKEPKLAYALARIYALGILGVTQNDELAFKYFARAADLGMPLAQLFAGLYAMEGNAGPLSTAIALDYFKQSSTAGFLVADKCIMALRRDIGWWTKSLELTKLSILVFKIAAADPTDSMLFLLSPVATPKFD